MKGVYADLWDQMWQNNRCFLGIYYVRYFVSRMKMKFDFNKNFYVTTLKNNSLPSHINYDKLRSYDINTNEKIYLRLSTN